MRTETYTCDRCGRSATERVKLYRNQIDGDGMHAYSFDMVERDLCATCVAELAGWIGAERTAEKED